MAGSSTGQDGGNNFWGRETTRFSAGGVRGAHWLSGRVPAERHRHGHAHPHFLLVTGGTYISRLAAGGRFTSPLMFCPGGVVHDDHVSDAGGSFLTITLFDEGLLETLDRRLPADSRMVLDPLALGTALRLLRQSNAGGDARSLEFTALELIGQFCGGPGERRKPRWLARAMALAVEAPEMSIDAVATHCGVHPVHLARTFRRFVGCSPAQFRTAQRLRGAADALRLDTMPISEIAIAQGFADQSHFTKSFSKIYGVAPGRYRAVR